MDGYWSTKSTRPIIQKLSECARTGATIWEVHAYLKANGINRSNAGVRNLLKSIIYLGRIEYGELFNNDAHPAIIDEATWQKVQRRKDSRGRQCKFERLLASPKFPGTVM
jgi:hypothetical protein